MSIDMGDPGVSGFGGYANQGNSGPQIGQSNPNEAPSAPQSASPTGAQASSVSAEPPAANGGDTAQSAHVGAPADADGHDHAEASAEPSFNYDQVPDFETSASGCFNRAAQIAQSLNHTNLSSDHLMLALTMDPNARRLLERVGDINQLREAAMRRVSKMHSRLSRSADDQPLSPTSDLSDIAKRAREMAAEREQSVAISDLVAAFPRADGRLSYGSTDSSQAMALMVKIEQGLVPRVAEAMTRIESAVREAMQRQHQWSIPFCRTSTTGSRWRWSKGSANSWMRSAGRFAMRQTRRSLPS